MKKQSKRGGARKGAGRPLPFPSLGKTSAVCITLYPAQMEKLLRIDPNISRAIRILIDRFQ